MAVDTYALTQLATFKTYLGVTTSTDDTLMEDLIDAASARIEAFIDRKILTRSYIDYIDPEGSRVLSLRQRPVTAVIFIGYGSKNVASFSYDLTAGVISASVEWVPSQSSGTGTLNLRSATTTGAITLTAFSASRSVSALVTAVNAGTDPITATLVEDARTEWVHQLGAADCIDGTVYLTAPSRVEAPLRVNLQDGTVTIKGSSAFTFECGDEDDTDFFGSRTFGRAAQTLCVNYTAGYATVPFDIEQTALELATMMWRSRKRDEGLSSESLGDYSYVNRGPAALNELLEERLSSWKRPR